MKKQPYLVSLEKGKSYAWCECAGSQSQPFCDGSHTKINKKRENLVENLKEISFKDLWGDHGVFTTMWIFGKPPKILFFKKHINNLIKSLKYYGIKKDDC